MNSIHCIGDYRRAEAEITQLRAQIEQLEYEVDHWKREAFQLVEADLVDAVQVQFGLTGTEATICAALYQRRDKLLASSTLEGLLDEERGLSIESNIVSVMICKIRAKLGEDSVETFRGRGYRLSAAMLAAFDAKLG